jgi:hypothetical protein
MIFIGFYQVTHNHLHHPFSGHLIENLVAQCKICRQHVFEVRVCSKTDEMYIVQKVLMITDSLICAESRGFGCKIFDDHLKKH